MTDVGKTRAREQVLEWQQVCIVELECGLSKTEYGILEYENKHRYLRASGKTLDTSNCKGYTPSKDHLIALGSIHG